jgi:hypothetical protein
MDDLCQPDSDDFMRDGINAQTQSAPARDRRDAEILANAMT